MSKEKLFENWDCEYSPIDVKNSEIVVESGNTKHNESIIGKIVGKSFFGDAYSRNGRFYPTELWENALGNPHTKNMLERGLMFACIGHPEKYTLDELLSSGATAAKVSKIEYKDKIGIVEFEILDTPAGRILNTIFKSGSKPYVSTRAFGEFSKEVKIKDGKKFKVLEKNAFELESIDFVINPGFLETDVSLVESIKEDAMTLKAKNIKCSDGLCSLNLAEKFKEETPKENKLENLSKENLLQIIKSMKDEVKFLTEETTLREETDEFSTFDALANKDEKTTFKFFKQFVNYIDLLLKLLKYDITYIKEYEDFIMLSKKDIFSKEIINKIKDFCEKILADEFDESLGEICNYILKIIELNSGKSPETSDEKSPETSDEKELQEQLDKFDTDKILEKIFGVDRLKSENENISKKIEDLKKTSQNSINKFITTKQISEKLGEILSKKEAENLKDKKLIKELENKVILSESKSIDALTMSERKFLDLERERKSFERKLSEKFDVEKETFKKEIRELKIKNNELDEELETISKIPSLKETHSLDAISELQNTNSELRKQLEEREFEITSLKEKRTEIKEDANEITSLKENLKEKYQEIEDLKEKLTKTEQLKKQENNEKDYKVKYFVEKFRVPEEIVKEFIKLHKSDAENQLERYKKINGTSSKINNFDLREEIVQPKEKILLKRLVNL